MFFTALSDALCKDVRPRVKLEGLDVLESLADFARTSVVSLGQFSIGRLFPFLGVLVHTKFQPDNSKRSYTGPGECVV
jgi:hypothetical protein